MMLPTHIVIGLILFLPISNIYQNYPSVILLASITGSIFPDFDMIYMNHRKTLHPIFIYFSLSIIFLLLSIVTDNLYIIFLSVMIPASFIHTLFDTFGTNRKKHPWKYDNKNVVYSYILGRWIKGRRYIEYDGCIKDLLLLLFSSILFIYYNNMIKYTVVVYICISIGLTYTLVRKRVPKIENYIYENIDAIRYIKNII